MSGSAAEPTPTRRPPGPLDQPPGAIMEILFPGLLPEGQTPRWGRQALRLVRIVAVTLICILILGASIGLAGPLGLVIAADSLAGLALLFLLARTPQGSRGHAAQSVVAFLARVTRGRFPPGRRRRPVVQASEFPTFLKISSDLGWAAVSRWHYDHGTRPLLARVMQAALADRHHLDLAADPQRARQFMGDDLWPFLDPAGPPSQDSRAPGVDLPTLALIVDRLESL
jgi:hypothetical protein